MRRRLLCQALMCQTFALLVLAATHTASHAQSACTSYHAAVANDSSGFVPVIPDQLLVDWRAAVPCLIEVLKSLSGKVRSPTMQSADRTVFLSTTAALRAISTKLTTEDAKRSTKDLDEFINIFRRHDSIDVTAVLTYGARNDLAGARLNAVVILGNVIDNTTVCVPLVQVFDNSLEKEPHYVNGRANLLSIIAVVAPWAYRENFDNIERTRKFFLDRIDSNDLNLKQTVAILENIEKRLKAQTTKTNQSVRLPEAWRKSCKEYMDNYQPKFTNTESIQY